MATAPPRTEGAPPPSGGNCNIRGATRRQHADSQLLMLQNPTATSAERAAGAEGQAGAPVGVGSPATAHTEGATAKQISPNKNHAVPLRYKTLPARAARPHFRYKTLPARPKWPNLALFLHAGRVLYRTRGRDGARQQDTRPHRCGGRQQGLVQTNFARNFPRSFFETTRKRCNSNGTNSMFEVIAGELRAKLLRVRPGRPQCRRVVGQP